MKNNLSKYWMQIMFFIVLFFGAIGNINANDLGELPIKIEVEKGTEGYNVVKAWEDSQASVYGVIGSSPNECRCYFFASVHTQLFV